MREHELEMGWNRHRIVRRAIVLSPTHLLTSLTPQIALTGLSNPEDMAKGLDNGGPSECFLQPARRLHH